MIDRYDLDGSIKGKGQVERIDPNSVPKGILSIHQVRYEFAKSFCVDKMVLDLACGAGYGTSLLSSVASRVVGVDIDHLAIDFAKEHYAKSNVEFQLANALSLPFPEASFDTIVSFETIEHLPDIPAYLREVSRVLRPNGIYIVSTPKVRRTTMRPRNPHHAIEYCDKDFLLLLRQYFPQVELYGQSRVQSQLHIWLQRLDFFHLRRWIPKSVRYGVVQAAGSVPYEEMSLSDQKIDKNMTHAHDMIAVCKLADIHAE